MRTQRRRRHRRQLGGDYPPILNVPREERDTDFAYVIRQQDLRAIERMVAENPRIVNTRVSVAPDYENENENENNNNNEDTDYMFYTPLLLATDLGYMPIVKYLIEHNAKLDENYGNEEFTAYDIAIQNEDKSLIDYFVSISDDTIKSDILMSAAQYNSIYTLQSIIQSGYNVNTLYTASSTYMPFNVKVSLLSDVLLNGNNISVDFISILVAAGLSVYGEEANQISPLTAAVSEKRDDNSIFEYLLAHGADVNGSDYEFSTPFIAACSVGYSSAGAKWLVDHGADVNKTDLSGNNALHWAAQSYAGVKQVEFAFNSGVNIHKVNANGYTPLHCAIFYDTPLDVIQFLINHGSDINAKTNSGETPLHLYILSSPKILQNKRKKDKIEFLIQNGAKVTPEILNAPIDNNLKEFLKSASMFWKGFTKSDFEKFNTIFDPENPSSMKNVSVCPVCLKYVERSEACNYMSHNCSSEGYFHNELYTKYKNSSGIVNWCTICGRICKGHSHFELGQAGAPVPPIIPGRDPFAPDCRVDGGGGIEEKIMRFRAMHEYAAELQTQVGKISHKDALDELVEAMWLPASMPRVAKRIMNTRAFNTPLNAFPNVEPANNNAAPRVNGAPPGSFEPPQILTDVENSIMFNDTLPVIKFTHKNRSGVMTTHESVVNKETLLGFLTTSGSNHNRCFEPACEGYLWPEEIEVAFAEPLIAPSITDADRAALANYKERFYSTYVAAGGASPVDVFQPVTDAICAVPPRPRGGYRRITQRRPKISRIKRRAFTAGYKKASRHRK